MLIKKIFITITLVFLFSSIQAITEKTTHGILFKSGASPINQRTSLSLFEEDLRKFKNNFSLSFELSLWDIEQFGYIFRIIDEKEKEVSFVFVNFRGENDLFFDFNSSITNKSLQIPIDKNDLKGKKWFLLKFDFDLKSNSATVFLQNKSYTLQGTGLTISSSLKFVYGLYGTNLDVPRIAIRDIRIEEQGKLKYAFPLNEADGEEVHDSNGKAQGYVKNPEWIINHHYHWKKEISFHSDCTAGIAYDELHDRIIVINRDSVNFYEPQSESLLTHTLSPQLPFTIFSGEAIYNPEKNECYVYDLDPINEKPFSMSVIELENYSVQNRNPSTGNTLHHHNVFWGNNYSDLYIFGGYGSYSYSNLLYRYDKNSDQWDPVGLKGDKINPRFFSACGHGDDPSEILIFGGFGNESGKQELGGRNLFDLFSIDLETKEISKRWELHEPSTLFVPCSNLVLNQEKTHFYTLCCPHHQVKTTTQLYKFNISDGSYEIVSTPIPMLSEKINTTVYLFFNEPSQRFYAVIREFLNNRTSEIRIYSILAPPVSENDLMIKKQDSFPVIPCAVATCSFVLLFLIIRRFYSGRNQNTPEKIRIGTEGETPKEPSQNAVFVLGDMTVFDNKGTDITHRFSAKLKSLYALILFNSKNAEGGISTESLTAKLWPEKDINGAKNIRGVTVKHLRNILTDMDGITLVHQNSKYLFTFKKSFYCDYIRCVQIMEDIQNSGEANERNLDELLLILKKGTLFPQLQDTWIDSYKSDFENQVEKILIQSIVNLYSNKKYHQMVRLSEVYFMIDPLNEEVLDLSLKAFKKIGKEKQAEILYSRFSANYKNSMGEEYKK